MIAWLLPAAALWVQPAGRIGAWPRESAPQAAARAAADPPGETTARQQLAAAEYEAATATLRGALAETPDRAVLHFLLARARYELEDFESAIDHAARAVALEPGNAEYHLWLGRASGEQADRSHSFGLARKTRHEFEAAVKLAPDFIAARRDLMEFYLDAPWIVGGGRDKARAQADAIARADPLAGHLARAAIWRKDKDWEAAAAEYRTALQMRPPALDPYVEAAEFYEARGDAGGLAAIVTSAEGIDPGDPRLLYFRGVARVLATDTGEAERLLSRYLEAPRHSEWPSHASAHEWLARALEQAGRRAEAAAEYREALTLDPRRKASREALKRLQAGDR